MTDHAHVFELTIDQDGHDVDELVAGACRSISDDLAQVPGVSLELLHARVDTAGAKAIDGNIIGLIVALSGAGALLPTALSVLREWLMRQPPSTKVRIKSGDTEVEWDGATPPAEVAALIGRLVPKA